MTLPTTILQVAIYALLVVPGISFTTTRSWVKGWTSSDKSVAARILEATFISVIFDSIYGVAILGLTGWNSPGELSAFLVNHPFISSLLAVTSFLVVPALVSYIAFANLTWTRLWSTPIRYPKLNNAFSNIPTAWDAVAANLPSGRFVRVRLIDGTWVGGWFSTRSFMSTYPEPRDLFIEAQYDLSGSGEFGKRVNETAGVWVKIDDGVIVEWLDPAPIERSQEGKK